MAVTPPDSAPKNSHRVRENRPQSRPATCHNSRMGDAGEGLVDAEARIQERLEERTRDRTAVRAEPPPDPERQREIESLRLGRTELTRQLETTTHPRRRAAIEQGIADLDRRIAALQSRDAKTPGPREIKPPKSRKKR